jgi:predicted ester cyclase
MATAPTANTQAAPLQDQLERGLRGLPERWLPRVGGLDALLTRWETAWNTHDLDLLETAVTEDVVWEDPAMFGETVHGRSEFRAFTEILFHAIPDVHFEDAGEPHLALEGTGLALPWRMTGTFTGELAFWGKRYGSQPPTWAPTGRRLDIEGVDLYEFRDGLISHWKIVYDVYGMLQQIGLLPPADRPIPSLVLRAQRLIASRQWSRARG